MKDHVFEGRHIPEVVNAWIEFHRLHEITEDYAHETDAGGGLSWAGELLMRAARTDPEFCWRATSKLIDLAESEEVIASVAAGPLEDLLCYHGAAYIDALEELSKSNQKVHEAVLGVWPNTIDRNVWQRIERLQAQSPLGE